MFCPECGTDHHVADRAAEAAADREVTLAKIEADKVIKVEQIRAGAARDLAETDNALSTARAEGVAEGMETVIDAGAGVDQAAEPGEPGEPIVVEAPAAEPEPAAAELEPPIVETSSSSPSSGSSSSSGWWAGYR
jgi:hypothetical protein